VTDLLDRRLLVVTGKGGVGKSTVAAALGLLAAGSGRRVALVEVAARDHVSRTFGLGAADVFRERPLTDGLFHVSVDAEPALREYLADQLPVKAMADVLTSSRAFAYLAAATPGFRELLTMGKVWELAQDTRRTPNARPYDLVVLDAPATGHAIALLDAPRTFADAARVGPIARQGRTISEMLLDPRRTAVVAVATPEELPVSETLMLRDRTHATIGAGPALAVANAVRTARLTGPEVQRAGAVAAPPVARAVLRAHDVAREQQAQLGRLRRGLATTGVPVVTLPFAGDGDLGPDELRELGRILGRRLAA
jgi:Mrp family chromosome partitioning ATPase